MVQKPPQSSDLRPIAVTEAGTFPSAYSEHPGWALRPLLFIGLPHFCGILRSMDRCLLIIKFDLESILFLYQTSNINCCTSLIFHSHIQEGHGQYRAWTDSSAARVKVKNPLLFKFNLKIGHSSTHLLHFYNTDRGSARHSLGQ